MSRTPRIEHVAKLAGVSVATVSRALRGLPNVAEATREKVQAAADELKYRPDPSASALAAGRTRTVAMAVPMLDSWYFSQVMAGAEAILTAAGYDLLLFHVDSDERRRRLLDGPLVKRADGLILVDLRVPPDDLAPLLEAGVHVVTVGMEVRGCSAVLVDDVGAARSVIEHLLGLGHQRIGLIEGLSDDPMRFSVPAARRRGYLEALAEVGGPTDPALRVSGGFSVVGGFEAMGALLDLDEPPTAVFAMSDEMAFGALRMLWERGLRVPRDVSIVGFDDHEVAAVLGLTTVQQQVGEHGAVAAELLLENLSTPGTAPSVRLAETSFVQRGTTGVPTWACDL